MGFWSLEVENCSENMRCWILNTYIVHPTVTNLILLAFCKVESSILNDWMMFSRYFYDKLELIYCTCTGILMYLVLVISGNIGILQIYWVSSFIFIFASPSVVWHDSAWISFGWHLWFRIRKDCNMALPQGWPIKLNTYPTKIWRDLTCESEILPAMISASHLSLAIKCQLFLAFASCILQLNKNQKNQQLPLCVFLLFRLPSDLGRWKHASQNANANRWYCFRMSE